MLAALSEQLQAGGEGVRRRGMRAGLARLGLVAPHDEAAADRVVVLFAQHAAAARQCVEAHAVGMAWQPLVMHEEQLHRLVEGDLVLAEQADAPARADALHRGLDAVRIDGLGVGAFEAGEHGAIGAVAEAREGERAVETYGDLLRRRELPRALQRQHELPRRPHRPHGVRARRADADLEDVKDA